MNKVIGIPANGPELLDNISEHFGHCSYFVGIELDEKKNLKKIFSMRNNGHSNCMEPVLNMKNRNVTDMIISGIGGRPYMGFLQIGINLYQGVHGKSIKENVELLLEGKLKNLIGPSCDNSRDTHQN
ncbi:MAG: NifB/NifX family molybdenum-iron cluster-binding protein [Promethearchaeota archaeon]